MKISILASGSTGNCIAIRTDKTTILIDAGIAKTKIEKRLLEEGIRPDSIDNIFITHAHSDHIKGITLANKYSIPVFAAHDEWKDITGVESKHIYYLDKYESIPSGGLEILSFPVHHDAYDPRGYTITTDKLKISICLDTGHVDADVLETMKDSKVYIIEANHDVAMLENGGYPDRVKSRILSDNGHLSNQQTAEALAQLVKGQGERIFLTHLSSENNIPELAKVAVLKKLQEKGFKHGEHYRLGVK